MRGCQYVKSGCGSKKRKPQGWRPNNQASHTNNRCETDWVRDQANTPGPQTKSIFFNIPHK